jgi:selenocysteine lyase/cysteine desulfurase
MIHAPARSATPALSEERTHSRPEVDFLRRFPAYAKSAHIDTLRKQEYARLDAASHVYLDYTGGGLYAESQLRTHMELLSNNVFGNPHSNNPTSLAMTRLVESARRAVLEFFNANPDEYLVVFTPNCSGALHLVGEAYPFAQGGEYLLAWDNHNSVNGIREFAQARGARVTYLPVHAPAMRFDADEMRRHLHRPGNRPRLFAFPAQSNFSGVQHDLAWVAEAQALGWDVLLDCAAFAPTNRLDLSQVHPDYVPLSFYKLFGYPTGVGALIMRRATLERLRRPWFAGGTITIASVQDKGWHYLIRGEAGFEDGTVNYLSLPAVEIGLDHMRAVGIDAIHTRVVALTGWLLEEMAALRHSNGAPLVQIFGPQDTTARGGTIAFNFVDPAGEVLDYRRIEMLASDARISLRTGCFCNPGAGEIAHGITHDEMAQCFRSSEPVTYQQLYDTMQQSGKTAATFRISLGIASNFADVRAFMNFAQQFRDVAAADFAAQAAHAPHDALLRDVT